MLVVIFEAIATQAAFRRYLAAKNYESRDSLQAARSSIGLVKAKISRTKY